MTKFEIRVLTIAMLDICKGDILLDVGAGTGSIAIQAALQGAEVYAIEREAQGIELIHQNADKFGIRIHVLSGSAPEAIEQVPQFNKCFIGGSGGKLARIVETVHARSFPESRIVANFIRPENMVRFTEVLKAFEYTQIEAKLIQTSLLDDLGLLRGQNPVFIIKAEKT